MKPTDARTRRSFAVTPPPAHAWALLVALGGVLPLVAIGVGLRFSAETQDWRSLLPVILLLPLVLAMLLFSLHRRRVELRDGILEVRAALYRKRLALAELDLERARVVDLRERTELRPLLKTNGMSLPGFHAGHFRLREKFGKAFCLLTDRRRVLWLPLRDGKQQLLLSLEHPHALLEALRSA